MPSVSVSEEDKDYLEELRKKYHTKKIPKMNEIIHYLLNFIRKRENEFINEQK